SSWPLWFNRLCGTLLACRQILDDVQKFRWRQRARQILGHAALFGLGHFIDIFGANRLLLAAGDQQRYGIFRLRENEAHNDLAVVGNDRCRYVLRTDLFAWLDNRLDDVVPVQSLADVGQFGPEREADFVNFMATGTHAAEDVATVVGVAGKLLDGGVRLF